MQGGQRCALPICSVWECYKEKKKLLVLLYILFQTVCKAVIPHKYILFFAKILGIPHDVT